MKTSMIVSAALALAVCSMSGFAADVATAPATTALATSKAALMTSNGDPYPATFKLASGEVLTSLNVQDPPPGPDGKLSPQAGVRISGFTEDKENKVKIVVFTWNDKTLGKVSRRVVITPDTLINFNGTMAKYDDLTEAKAKSGAVVATLNTTGVYGVLLRFDHGLLKVSADDLSPKQVAALTAVTPVATAASNQSFEKKSTDIVATLKLNDPAKEKVVYDAVLKQTEGVRDAHNAGFGPPKTLHAELLASLKTVLTPEQVDQVKDALTNNLYPAALKSFTDANKDLGSEDLKVVTSILAQAREESMDLKNLDEQQPVFAKYKSQVKSYLTAHGH